MTTPLDGPETPRQPRPTNPGTAPVLLNMHRVCARTSLSPMTVRRMIERERFPRPVRLSQQRIAWRTADIEAWEASLVEVA